jgi:phosphoribosylglycinamide formyltransferase-1
MKKIGWFTTARGPGSFNLFTAMLRNIDSGKIDATLSFVFINRDVKGNEYRTKLIAMAEERGIPVIIYPSDTFRPDLKEKDLEAWRDDYGQGVRERISQYDMDFGVLAGYMLIVDPETCRKYPLINLHPALPDTYKGTWEEIIGQVVENRDARYGATVHVCSPELDRGDIIAYDWFDVEAIRKNGAPLAELVKQVRAEELKREAPLLMETIKLLVDGSVALRGGHVFDEKGHRVKGDLSLAEKVSEDLKET